MKETIGQRIRLSSLKGKMTLTICTTVFLVIWFEGISFGQGTMTFNFNAYPPGSLTTTLSYTESGMLFYNPYGPESLIITGGGFSNKPENGTGYLQVSGGAKLVMNFSAFPSPFFNLVSFDAAEYSTGFGVSSIQFVGIKGMGVMVTNTFILDGIIDGTGPLQDFETFYFDSLFHDVHRVEVYSDRWSLDNLVVSGIPEPASGTLLLLGTLGIFGYARMKRKTSPPLP